MMIIKRLGVRLPGRKSKQHTMGESPPDDMPSSGWGCTSNSRPLEAPGRSLRGSGYQSTSHVAMLTWKSVVRDPVIFWHLVSLSS
jgi:hypothetical protein